jgi:DNA-binding CsgD family transcriptional regulator
VGQVQARALLRAATGRRREALEDLRECGRLEAEWAIATPALTSWRSHAAPLVAASGRTQEARDLVADELDRASAFGARRPLGVALRAAGRVHDGAERLAFLEQAADVLTGSEARLEEALALTDLGAELRRGGRRGDARRRLRDAMELARACGADAASARAHDELVAAGARPRRDPLESRSTLTASELRVARLAAEGLRNREIAQTLFLTEKTIEVHLTSAYRKLDIGSRSQLPRALTSTGA